MRLWHPLVVASALAAASVGGATFVPWLFVGVTAGLATSGST